MKVEFGGRVEARRVGALLPPRPFVWPWMEMETRIILTSMRIFGVRWAQGFAQRGKLPLDAVVAVV